MQILKQIIIFQKIVVVPIDVDVSRVLFGLGLMSWEWRSPILVNLDIWVFWIFLGKWIAFCNNYDILFHGHDQCSRLYTQSLQVKFSLNQLLDWLSLLVHLKKLISLYWYPSENFNRLMSLCWFLFIDVTLLMSICWCHSFNNKIYEWETIVILVWRDGWYI